MRKLPGLFTVFAAVAVLATVNAASATPPTGQFSATDHGRAQQAANATLTIPPAEHVSSNYTIAPGGDTGWRTGTGDSVIAVFKGTLAVEQAQDCAGQDVAAGKAVVVPAGKFRLHNAGNQPAEFSGVFFNLPVGGPNPLVEGQAEPAPACAGFSATAAAPDRNGAQDRARYVARPAWASLLSRLERCRPSSTNSTAEATSAGASPTSRSPSVSLMPGRSAKPA